MPNINPQYQPEGYEKKHIAIEHDYTMPEGATPIQRWTLNPYSVSIQHIGGMGQGSANAIMGESFLTNYAVGNLPVNSQIEANDSVASVVKRMVRGYKAATAKCSGGGTFEAGTTASGTISFSGTPGSEAIQKVELKIGNNVVATASGNSGTYSFSVTEKTTFTCVVTETSGKTITATTTVAFSDSIYYGVCDDGNFPVTFDVNSAEIRRLTKTNNNTVSVDFNDIMLAILYPSSKTLSSVKTDNGEELLSYGSVIDITLTRADKTTAQYKYWLLTNKTILNINTTIKFA